MSFYTIGEDESLDDMIFDLNGSNCFLCNKKLSNNIVMWHGTALIVMHPNCARKLGKNLIDDAKKEK